MHNCLKMLLRTMILAEGSAVALSTSESPSISIWCGMRDKWQDRKITGAIVHARSSKAVGGASLRNLVGLRMLRRAAGATTRRNCGRSRTEYTVPSYYYTNVSIEPLTVGVRLVCAEYMPRDRSLEPCPVVLIGGGAWRVAPTNNLTSLLRDFVHGPWLRGDRKNGTQLRGKLPILSRFFCHPGAWSEV